MVVCYISLSFMHISCAVHACVCMCTPTNHNYPLGRPMWAYTENFVKIRLDLTKIWWGNEISTYLAIGFTVSKSMNLQYHPWLRQDHRLPRLQCVPKGYPAYVEEVRWLLHDPPQHSHYPLATRVRAVHRVPMYSPRASQRLTGLSSFVNYTCVGTGCVWINLVNRWQDL